MATLIWNSKFKVTDLIVLVITWIITPPKKNNTNKTATDTTAQIHDSERMQAFDLNNAVAFPRSTSEKVYSWSTA